jgi:hypothetical protein
VTVVESFGPAQEAAWRECEQRTITAMGTINLATADLVRTIAMLDATGGWRGHGIRSLEHWVQWKAGVSERRARDLVNIAQRIDELPRCWTLFAEGRLTEDAMALLARRLPATRDAELAQLVPELLISQLHRILRSCPEVPNRKGYPGPEPEPERYVGHYKDRNGWMKGRFCLPPSEGAELEAALGVARDQEFREAQALSDDADVNASGRASVNAADGFMRLVREGCDALDKDLQRTGHRGERCQVVLHHDVDRDGTLGPGQLDLGDVVPDTVARFLSCDAHVRVMAWQAGRLLGINPTERTVSRRLRRAIERRDQGCMHPLCNRRRHLHIHHLQHWAEGGLTIPANLLCLCTLHHRELHEGLFTIKGDPEVGPLRFFDARGRPIEPPEPGSPGPLRLVEPSPYTQPYGGRLATGSFSWN